MAPIGARDHQAIGLRSWKRPPVGSVSASVASQVDRAGADDEHISVAPKTTPIFRS